MHDASGYGGDFGGGCLGDGNGAFDRFRGAASPAHDFLYDHGHADPDSYGDVMKR